MKVQLLKVRECPKLKEKEAKKKESSMTIADTSFVRTNSINIVHDGEWEFILEWSYDPFAHDEYMTTIDMDVWYFDSGANKDITSHPDFFPSLQIAPIRSTLMCANKSSYPLKGIEKF